MWIVACTALLLAATPTPPPGSPPQAPSYPSEEALRRYAQARLLEESGASAEALGEYFRILAVDPRSTATMLHISELAAQTGENQRSLELAQRALDADSANAHALWLKGSAQFNMGRGGEALVTLQEAVAADSLRPEYARSLGRVAEALDRFDLVVRAYSLVVAVDFDDAESWFQLAAGQARLGHFDLAQQALNEARAGAPMRPGAMFLQGWIAEGTGRRELAIESYRAHLAVHRDDQVTRERLVQLLASEDQYADALVEARRVSNAAPQDLDALETYADLALRTGHTDEGKRALQRMEDIDPGSANVLSRRLEVLARNKLGREAHTMAVDWSRQHPGDYQGPQLEARTLAVSGKLSDAEAPARRAVEIAPDSLGPRLLLGRILQGQSKWQAAAAVWQETLRRYPDRVPVALDLAFCRQQMGDISGSEATVREVLVRFPDNATALNFLGYQMADENRNLDEAKNLIQRAVAIEPDNGAFVDSMGWVLYRLGDLTGARRQLERAVELTGGDATVHEHLGDVYRDLQLRDMAREQYQKCLAQDRGNNRVQGKLQDLR